MSKGHPEAVRPDPPPSSLLKCITRHWSGRPACQISSTGVRASTPHGGCQAAVVQCPLGREVHIWAPGFCALLFRLPVTVVCYERVEVLSAALPPCRMLNNPHLPIPHAIGDTDRTIISDKTLDDGFNFQDNLSFPAQSVREHLYNIRWLADTRK